MPVQPLMGYIRIGLCVTAVLFLMSATVSSFSVGEAFGIRMLLQQRTRVLQRPNHPPHVTLSTTTTTTRLCLMSNPQCHHPRRQRRQLLQRYAMPFHTEEASSIWTAVEVFDGSTIVDPVVVSNVFWASLQAKIATFVLGQLLATIAFVFLLSVASSQLSKAADFVTSKIFSDVVPNPGIKVPRNLRDDDNINGSNSSNNDNSEANKIKPDFGKLLLCVAIDVIGTSSELVPILGEVTDIVTAPIAALALRSLFGGSNIVFFLEFAEEILPFTDILPLATLCWVIDTFFGETDLAKLLQLGRYRSTGMVDTGATSDIKFSDRSSAIDVKKLD